jgi:signal transduction histidine kinase
VPKLFERFYRAGRRPSSSGAGLGLSIARTIVEGHGGSIDADSQPGDGTTMTIRVPLWQVSAASADAAI